MSDAGHRVSEVLEKKLRNWREAVLKNKGLKTPTLDRSSLSLYHYAFYPELKSAPLEPTHTNGLTLSSEMAQVSLVALP